MTERDDDGGSTSRIDLSDHALERLAQRTDCEPAWILAQIAAGRVLQIGLTYADRPLCLRRR